MTEHNDRSLLEHAIRTLPPRCSDGHYCCDDSNGPHRHSFLDKPWDCPECARTNPHKCDLCGERFPTEAGLRDHVAQEDDRLYVVDGL